MFFLQLNFDTWIFSQLHKSCSYRICKWRTSSFLWSM